MLSEVTKGLQSIVFAAKVLPDGSQVLVPSVRRPRTCRRLDGIVKVAYEGRAAAKAARTKHDVVYRCPNCKRYHLATKKQKQRDIDAESTAFCRAA